MKCNGRTDNTSIQASQPVYKAKECKIVRSK